MSVTYNTLDLSAVWIQPARLKDYSRFPDDSVQFITTENESEECINVLYTTLSGEVLPDCKRFSLRCDNADTDQWSYYIRGCTDPGYKKLFLNNYIPSDEFKHWIVTKTSTHLKVVCNNVTVLDFNFATDYSPGNEISHQIWLRRCRGIQFRSYYQYSLLLNIAG